MSASAWTTENSAEAFISGGRAAIPYSADQLSCIHHMTHGRKYVLYEEIFGHLVKNGLFINIDHAESHSKWGKLLPVRLA